jgi:mycofactocin precursor
VLSALSATTLSVEEHNCIFLEEFMNTAPASVVVETVVEDLLEDVSIDGMCGVY